MWYTLPESNINSFEFSACNVMLGFNVKDDYIVDNSCVISFCLLQSGYCGRKEILLNINKTSVQLHNYLRFSKTFG